MVMKKTYKLEVWGEMCPIPLIKAQKQMKTMNVGDILIMETEHACTSRGVVVWAKKNKYDIEETEVDNGIWRLVITKTHD